MKNSISFDDLHKWITTPSLKQISFSSKISSDKLMKKFQMWMTMCFSLRNLFSAVGEKHTDFSTFMSCKRFFPRFNGCHSFILTSLCFSGTKFSILFQKCSKNTQQTNLKSLGICAFFARHAQLRSREIKISHRKSNVKECECADTKPSFIASNLYSLMEKHFSPHRRKSAKKTIDLSKKFPSNEEEKN